MGNFIWKDYLMNDNKHSTVKEFLENWALKNITTPIIDIDLFTRYTKAHSESQYTISDFKNRYNELAKITKPHFQIIGKKNTSNGIIRVFDDYTGIWLVCTVIVIRETNGIFICEKICTRTEVEREYGITCNYKYD